MTTVAAFSMSLDGFIADPSDGVGPLFEWYENGEVEVDWPGNDMVSRTSPASAAYLEELISESGAVVAGRRIFDITSGWEGAHPLGVPIVVVSHSIPDGWPRPGAPVTFTDNVEHAVAQAKEAAGGKLVGVAGANVAQQCLDAGLLDEIRIDLVPVLLGAGIRFFDGVAHPPVMFEDPDVIEGHRVTHLRYRLRT
jgi:dihydrofolate reductase